MKEQQLKQFLDFCQSQGFNIQDPASKQRIAVLSNDKSVIPAGAGSGKTTVLTYRFLRLLMDEDIERIHSNEILTITFTKAATANMKAKIYKILKKAQNAGLLGEEEIKNFSDAEISTTDSFCAKIVRQDSTRYGIASDFVIEDQDELEEFAARTIRKLLNEKIEDTELQALLCKFSIEDFEKAFKTIATSHINLTKPYPTDPVELYEVCIAALKEEYLPQIKSTKKTFEKLLDDFIDSYSQYDNALDDVMAARRLKIQLLDDKPVLEAKISTKKTGSKIDGIDEAFKGQKNQLKELIEKYNTLNSIFDPSSLAKLKTYAELIGLFQGEILKHKRINGFLTFHDVMLLSIDILRTNKEIRDRYRAKYKRIMVDEFQDNNEDNKRLVYLLSTKENYTGPDYPTIEEIDLNKIFMVGDEKQSIYKFRGADVSVFKQISKDFGEDRVLSLDQNFRSEKAIIDTINALFENSIMKTDETRDYEAKYRKLISTNERVKSSMHFLYMNTLEEEKNVRWLTDNPKSEAYAVASFIHKEIMGKKDQYQVPVMGKDGIWKSRDPEYSDIAILLKTGSRQGDYEKALKLFDIPFNVSDNKSLTMEAVFNDFYNLLQLAVYGKEDQLSYAAFLKSPLINADDAALNTLLSELRDPYSGELQYSEKTTNLMEAADFIIAETVKKLASGTIASVISFIWNDLGYRYAIETITSNYAFVEHYDYLFALACQFDSEGKSIVQMLDALRPMLGDTNKLKDLSIQQEKTSGVTIQSIHKSKGLEYPIVFVCDMGAGSKNDTGLTIYEQKGTGIPILPSVYEEDKDRYLNAYLLTNKSIDTQKENAETKRILYVAATRAVSHLIFSGVYGTKLITAKDKSPKKTSEDSKNTLLQYFTEGAQFSFDDKSGIINCINFSRVPTQSFKKSTKKQVINHSDFASYYTLEEQELPKGIEKLGVTTLIEEPELKSTVLGSSYTPQDAVTDTKVLPSIAIDSWFSEFDASVSLEDLTDEEIETYKKALKSKKITEFGTLTHQMLEDAILGQANDYSQYFQDVKERELVLETAEKLKDGFFASSFYTSIKDMEKYPEKEFLVRDGDRLVEGIIDLLCISENRLVIVDYKTDSVRIDSNHRNQLLFYVNAMKTIYPNKKIEAYVFYLRDPENVLSIQ